MWFDPYKLIANANFQDELAIDAGGGLGIDPVSSPVAGPAAPQIAPPVDALSQAAAPAGIPGGAADPFSAAGMVAPGMSPADLGGTGVGDATGTGGGGGGSWATADPSTFGGGGTPAGYAPTDAELSGAPTGTAPATPPTTPTTPTADKSYSDEAAKLTGATPGSGALTREAAGVGGGAGGGAGANAAFTQLANALRGVATAAQGGNPQAQQLMNMLRQMMQQQMMGGGAGYNPYMNQFSDPLAARMRMERMRREFMERQRLRNQLYPGSAAARHVGGTEGRRR
jgi:hypothetical protein